MALQPPSPGVAETFRPRQWLSDASISFVYARLTAGGSIGGAATQSDGSPSAAPLPEMVLLLDPAAAFWLTVQNDPRDVELAKSALKLHERQLLLCPINDTRDGSCADAGTHWTLLACWNQRAVPLECELPHDLGRFSAGGVSGTRSSGLFQHFSYYDSLGGHTASTITGLAGYNANYAQAQVLANKVAGRPVQVRVGACAKQTNSFDCGVYVLLFSQLIASAFLERTCTSPVSPGSSVRSSSWTASGRAASHRHGHQASCTSTSAPEWEDRLLAVTPKEVEQLRRTLHSFPNPSTTLAA